MKVSDEDGFSQFYVSPRHPENLPNYLHLDFGNKSSFLLTPVWNINLWINYNCKFDIQTIMLKTFLFQKIIIKLILFISTFKGQN